MTGENTWGTPYKNAPVDERLRVAHPADLIQMLRFSGLSVATAESLTGGGLCSRLVDVPGASEVVLGGICTYSSEKKKDLLDVSAELIDHYGPVQGGVALEMAQGAQKMFGSDMAISTTGVAGPGPSDGHPAGTVYVACVVGDFANVCSYELHGNRNEVRDLAIRAAISLAEATLKLASAHGTSGVTLDDAEHTLLP